MPDCKKPAFFPQSDPMPADTMRIAARRGFEAMRIGIFLAILDLQIVATSLQNSQ